MFLEPLVPFVGHAKTTDVESVSYLHFDTDGAVFRQCD